MNVEVEIENIQGASGSNISVVAFLGDGTVRIHRSEPLEKWEEWKQIKGKWQVIRTGN